jgi:hypothetical protein
LDEPIEVILTARPHGAYHVTKSNQGVLVEMTAGAAHAKALADMTPAAKFRLPAGGLQLTCKGYDDAQGRIWPLDTSGSLTAAHLDYLLRTNRQRYGEFVENMRRLIPWIADIRIGTPNSADRQVVFYGPRGMTFTDKTVSDGVKLCTFFVSLAWHPNPPKTILIEEPENGIHPKRLRDVMGLLKGLTTGELGAAPSQVILTTHSPRLLNLIDAKKDQLLVFRRNEDEDCTASEPDMAKLKHYFDDNFGLGEIWGNVSEYGLLGENET